MSFPYSLSGTVLVRGVGADEAIGHLVRALDEEKAVGISREGSSVHFRGWRYPGLRFYLERGSWRDDVKLISRGSFDASPVPGGVRVRFRVTFTHLLVLTTLMPVVPFVVAGPAVGLAALALCWGLVFWGNFLMASRRWRLFVERAMRMPGGPASPEA